MSQPELAVAAAAAAGAGAVELQQLFRVLYGEPTVADPSRLARVRVWLRGEGARSKPHFDLGLPAGLPPAPLEPGLLGIELSSDSACVSSQSVEPSSQQLDSQPASQQQHPGVSSLEGDHFNAAGDAGVRNIDPSGRNGDSMLSGSVLVLDGVPLLGLRKLYPGLRNFAELDRNRVVSPS